MRFYETVLTTERPAALSFKEEIKEIPLLHLGHKRKWFSQQRGPQLALVKKQKWLTVKVG